MGDQDIAVCIIVFVAHSEGGLCGVPSDLRFRTKPGLGSEIIREIVDRQ